jgi:hypothetical protein
VLESVDLAQGNFEGFFGEVSFFDLLAQQVHLAQGGIGFAEFALDDAELFTQEEVTLALAHGRGDFFLDFGAEGEDLEFTAHEREESAEALADIACFEELLTFFEAEVEIGGDEIGQAAWMRGIEDRHLDLVRHGWRQVENLLELALRVPWSSRSIPAIPPVCHAEPRRGRGDKDPRFRNPAHGIAAAPRRARERYCPGT